MSTESLLDDDKLRHLGRRIVGASGDIALLHEFIAQMLPVAVESVNKQFAPRQLLKQSRLLEPLPSAKRQLSSYRTRMGSILEYGISTQLDRRIKDLFADDLRLTFAVAHEYPDFFVRDAVLGPRIRIEMKAVDAESDEPAARFEVLQTLIQGEKDLVVLLGWEWVQGKLENEAEFEMPFIFSFVTVPAAELVTERDRSVLLRGGRVAEDAIYVRSKKNINEMVKDPHNTGKILRLVHQTRRAEPFSLSAYIRNYLLFCDSVKARKRAIRKRRKT